MRLFPPPSIVVAVLLLSGCEGCPGEGPKVVTRDASVDVARDVTTGRQGRRRRRGRRVQVAANQGSHAPQEPDNDPASAPDEAPESAPRPRITETGPMLPEDLGPPPSQTMDMGQASEGPLGLAPEQISHGFNPLLPRFGACAEATTDDQGHGPHGRVAVRVRIRNDGRPIAARVSGGGGPPEFTPCVRRVVAAARFDRFGGPDVMATWGFDVD